MQASGIHSLELIFLLLLLFVAGLAALAKRFQTPYPIVLVIGGLILSFFPRIPRVALNPDMVFLVILPPLLFSSAFATSWRDFRYNLVSISMLALGLVVFTVRGVASISHWILPGFDFRLGLVLGAVVSTTDAIAATAIAQRLGIPKRITSVIEGESLVNDASGLLALEFAVALVVSGEIPSLEMRIERLIYLIAGSIVIGLIIAKLIYYLETKIDDSSIEITISLIAPYFAYLAGESAHASGVLATVVCGLYLGHKSSLYLSLGARLKGSRRLGHAHLHPQWFCFYPAGSSASLRSRRNSRIYDRAPAGSGSHVQRGRHSSPYGLGLSRRLAFKFYPPSHPSPARTLSATALDPHHRLDRHARRRRPRRCHLAAGISARRLAVSPAQPHHLPHLLRNLRHSRLAGTYPSSAHSRPRPLRCGREKS